MTSLRGTYHLLVRHEMYQFMEHPNPDLGKLIDLASQIAGSDYKLAQLIGQSRQRISDWRHGRVGCPPEDQALMAAIANLDPIAELARATVRKHEGTAKGDLLMKALGKSSRLTGAIAGFVGAVALAISSLMPQNAEAGQALEAQCALCKINDLVVWPDGSQARQDRCDA